VALIDAMLSFFVGDAMIILKKSDAMITSLWFGRDDQLICLITALA
jgi:hypothetical protein